VLHSRAWAVLGLVLGRARRLADLTGGHQLACVLINDEEKALTPISSRKDESVVEDLVIPVVGVAKRDGKALRHNVKLNPDMNVDLSFSVRRARSDLEAEQSAGGTPPLRAQNTPRPHAQNTPQLRQCSWAVELTGVFGAGSSGVAVSFSMDSMPYVTLSRSDLFR
jgi:hypothetical protein